MLVIGLVGGVASGKSFVAKCFENLGAAILDADKIGHEVLRTPSVIEAIGHHWPAVVLADGQIDRRMLATIVFSPVPDGFPAGAAGGKSAVEQPSVDSRQLRTLEQITHPLIGQQIEQQLTVLRENGETAVVLDAPVLLKAGWDRQCDKIVFVEARLETRLARAAGRGWSDGEVARREQFQTPLHQKRAQATDFIDNSHTPEDTQSQVLSLWKNWGLPLATTPPPSPTS